MLRSGRSAMAIMCVAAGAWCHAQPAAQFVDGIIGVVGNETVLYSDLMAKEEQGKQGGLPSHDSIRCYLLEELLYEKLLLHQARVDSVEVNEDQVQVELDRRIRYFVQQLGSEKKLEEFYGKKINEIKAEFHDLIRDQLLTQTMSSKITSDVQVTPKEVERFFKKIPKDSLPFINAEVEFAQIVIGPDPSEEESRRVRLLLEQYKDQVAKGEKDFCTLAILYSEDPGSAENCGELGLVPRGVMVPEFDAVAFGLKDGEMSPVFKTEFGYHLMQMIERRGEEYNARHILMRPKVNSEDIQRAQDQANHIVEQVRSGELQFEEAVTKYSEDDESKNNAGLVVEPNSGSTKWEMGALDPKVFFVIDKLEEDQVSEPAIYQTREGDKALRIIKLMSRSEPHKADLSTDYLLIQQAAEGQKRSKAMDTWLAERIANTYIRIDPGHMHCPFNNDWAGIRSSDR